MDKTESRFSLWQLFILVLSIYVLLAMFVDTVFQLPKGITEILLYIDNLICIIFLTDFFYHLVKTKNKLEFLKWGWIDFISSIPYVPFLRIGRLARIIRVLRLLRSIRSTKFIIQYIFQNRVRSTLLSVALISLVLLVFSSIAVLNFETLPDSNIKNIKDALWWAVTTMTTVGYGDKYPLTSGGRIIAVALMVFGVGLFGTFTALVTTLFLSTEEKKISENEMRILDELKSIRKELEDLKNK